MSAMAELHVELMEAGYFAEPEQPDPHPERIDTYLEFQAAEDAAAGRRAEYQQLWALAEIADLAYCVTRYDLRTGKLHTTTEEN